MRKGDAVHALGADDVGVVHTGQLLWGERLDWAEDHVPGVVDDHIKPTALVDDLVDRGVDGLLV